MTVVACGAAPEGIPRELARERAAQISDLHYRLSYTLSPHPSTVEGHEEIQFMLDTARPMLLDFREGTVSRIEVNGAPAPVTADNGHLQLPGASLRAGNNDVSIDFSAPVAPAGRAITLYKDPEDGSEYVYTLFVPMDASMAFPCFDQPDLKGRFQLDVTAPADWTVISNTAARSTEAAGSIAHTVFAATEPISTYLFAFAAGPFRRIHDTPGLPGLYARQSQVKRAEVEANELQEVTARGIEYLSAYFAQPFPFPKYDLVLIPEFAYGGMEHAGCTFLREESVLFRRAPTHSDLIGRDILTLHELTHQWFGDFTTMRWFDDLWLKEGFAQYMAYQALSELKPDEGAWKRFYEQIKPLAYAIDSTKGTTPIFQEIPNLKDAKSAYGAIVYQKAPSVLKQMACVLGAEHFRDGLRLYLKEHAYGNAEWSDLVHAEERVSGQSLTAWAATWIRRRGMPQVNVDWTCDQNKLSRLSLTQSDVLGEGGVWPLSTQVSLHYLDGKSAPLRVDLKTRSAIVSEATGKACPAYVFANEEDYGYGRFLLDGRSRRAILNSLGSVKDPFEQSLLWGSLGIRFAWRIWRRGNMSRWPPGSCRPNLTSRSRSESHPM
ncbi:MAG: M1 family aminopeptidase [Bryobacteraceae bacterium]|jgi:aminopeptidase N